MNWQKEFQIAVIPSLLKTALRRTLTGIALMAFAALFIACYILADNGRRKYRFVDVWKSSVTQQEGGAADLSYIYHYSAYPEKHIWGPLYKLKWYLGFSISSDQLLVEVLTYPEGSSPRILLKKDKQQLLDIMITRKGKLIVSESDRGATFATPLKQVLTSSSEEMSTYLDPDCAHFIYTVTKHMYHKTSRMRSGHVYGLYANNRYFERGIEKGGRWWKLIDDDVIKQLHADFSPLKCPPCISGTCWKQTPSNNETIN